jgi:hypothetical protein
VLTAETTGTLGTCTIQWQSSDAENGTYTNINGANSTTYTAPTGTAGTTWYRATYINCTETGCNAEPSNKQSVIVVADPTITIKDGNKTVCIGGSVVLTAETTGTLGTCTIQWQSSDAENGTYTNINGANGTTYTAPTGTAGTTWYRATYINCTETGCNAEPSNKQSVIVVADPTITIKDGNKTVCVGGSVVLTAETTGTLGTCTIQWQSATSENGSYTNINGANSTTYTAPTGTAGTTWYRATYINCTETGCNAEPSNKQYVTVVADPRITTGAGGDYCVGTTVTLTSTPSGGTGTCTVQWQSATSETGTYTDISGANATTYTLPTGTVGETWYRATYSCTGGGCDAAASTPVRVRVYTIPIISCPATFSATCIQSFDPSLTGGRATASDFLGSVPTTYDDGDINFDCSSSSYYFIRTWTATNSCGSASCDQRIDVSTRFTEGCYTFNVSTYFNEALNRTTFRWTVEANGCAAGISNILFQVPTASPASCKISSRVNYPILYSPIGNYTGQTGTSYKVIYPQTEGKGKSAFTGIKFEVNGGEGIKNNQTEVFEYTLCGNYLGYAGKVAVKAGNNTVTETVDPDCVCKSSSPITGAANYTTMLGSGLTPSTPVTNNVNATEFGKLSLKSRVYPNPHDGKFNVQFTAIADGAATVEVYTMDGKRVQQKALQVRKGTQQSVPFTVPGKSSLIYRVVNGDQSSSGRILPN